ncbi:hypothetical protein ACWC4C_22745 [Streptomyces olivaceoviridis]
MLLRPDSVLLFSNVFQSLPGFPRGATKPVQAMAAGPQLLDQRV